MPRAKNRAPKKLGGSEETNVSAHEKAKKRIQAHTRRRVLPTLPPGLVIIGTEPLRCLWSCPEPNGPPTIVSWAFDDTGFLQIFADNVQVTPTSPVLAQILQGQRKLYELVCRGCNAEELLLDVAVAALPWPNATPVVAALNNHDYSDVSEIPEEVSSETAWEEFFKDLREAQSLRPRAVLAEFQHPELVPVLRGYQADAVQWMLKREGMEVPLDLDWLTDVADWVPVRGGPPLLYNKYSKTLNEGLECPIISRGGILADEMGLGKTVITLALILKNMCPNVTNMATNDESVDVSSSSEKVKRKKRPKLVLTSDESEEDWTPETPSTADYQSDSTSKDMTVNETSRDEEGILPERMKRAHRKRRRIQDLSDSSDDEPLIKTQRMKNQEDNLNADEKLQLVPSMPGGGMLRSKLNAWYESKLAELSCSLTKFTNDRRHSSSQFRCTCGAEVDAIPRGALQCSACNFYQHSSCVGYSRRNDYLCPACWKTAPRVVSAATLIVAPPAIYEQWGSEIERHAPNLKLFLYNGVSRGNFVQPSHLAEYDVVVTTYSVLSSETHLTEEVSERRLRNESRFLRQSSPLTCISWWRVVCDEAQLVESDVSRVCQMVQQLSATHRWSVTGTPIQHSIGDLFYLTQFIGLGSLDDKSKWNDFLLKPYLAGCKKPLLSVLNQVFWRSTKDSVSSELGLPEQTFKLHLLRFSAIEESFYMQQHSSCSAKFAEGIAKARISILRTLDSINKSKLSKLLQPLLSLRQACTHPQVVSGISIGSATGTANLSELLTYLSRKTKVECEEALRHHIGALNGMAGLHCLHYEWAEAIEYYRQVFRLAEEYQGKVKVDGYQRIHALHNAAEILESYSDIVPPTLRDGNLRKDAEEIEKEYRMKRKDVFSSSLAEAKALTMEISSIRELFESAPDAWWVPVILSLKDFEGEVMDKLHIDLATTDHKEKDTVKSFLKKLMSLRGVEVTVGQWWASLEKQRKLVLKAMHSLSLVPIDNLVKHAVMCHLKTAGAVQKGSQCELCKTEKAMLSLECDLFATYKKTFREYTHQIEGIDADEWDRRVHGNETKYSWKPHYAERTLIIIVNFAKSKQLIQQWCLNDSKRHYQLLENMKKEFKLIRTAWKELNHLVQAEDELTMSKIRLRFAMPFEEGKRITSPLDITAPDKMAKIHVIDPHDVNPMLLTLQTEAGAYLSNFKKKLGQMLYLQNLGQIRNAVPDPCPICKSALDEQWCVLQCGHCFCIQCIQVMCRRQVICPICRETTDSTGLSFVDMRKRVETEEDVPVLGDFSTKVDGIVRVVLKLLKNDSDTKILIFSSWVEVLKILQKALNLNHVKNLLLATASRHRTLQTFRDPASQISVLLLPVKLGSKGLNLTEATHVFLTEPILNSAEELQAIGRVHRIGQTKPTVVHRFLVKGTIEEKIQSTLSEAKDKWSNNNVTVGDLQNLFVVPTK